MSDCIISLQSIKYSWSQTQTGLDIDHFQVRAGEKVFIYGPSGSGKSTLLNLIAGIIVPQSGTINILGAALESLSIRQRDHLRAQHMGIIFQQFNLIPYLNVVDNLLLRAGFLPREQKAEALKKIPELVTSLKLSTVSHHKPYQLSVGQQQRVALARALLGTPKIIIADEPTSALDSELRGEFMNLLFEFAGLDTSVLFVSHDHTLLPRFDRVVHIQELCKSSASLSPVSAEGQ